MTTYRSKIGWLAAKAETTPGTAVAPGATDANVLVENLTVSPDVRIAERNPITTKLGKLQGYPGVKIGRVTFDMELKGSGSASDTPPDWGKFLKACGFSETVNATTSVVYAPAIAAANNTLTIDVYQDGRRWRMFGAAGNVRFSFRAGEVCRASFDFQGVMSESAPLTNDTFSGSPTFQSAAPHIFTGASFTAFGSAAHVSTLELDMGNEVSPRDSANATNGVSYFLITDRRPTGTADPEAVPNGTMSNTLYGKLEAGTQGAFSWTTGSGTGNTLAWSLPQVVVTQLTPGDRNGILIDNITIAPVMSAILTEDDFTITHT